MIDRRILKVKLRQNAFFTVVVVALVGGIVLFMFGGSPPPPAKVIERAERIKLLDAAGSREADKALWVTNQQKFDAINQRLADLEKEVDTKNARIDELEKKSQSPKKG